MELRCRSIDTVWINLSDDPGYLKEVKEYYDFPTVPVILKNNLDTGKVSFVGGCAQLLEGLDDKLQCNRVRSSSNG